ncbi:DUF6250 domain-containing protein [Mariniflexile sp.]|uniref:DUF6250 domain-containing protein n=1 Tax=Mariniflexile sp. TaxID=1979402 RepID=UPI0040486D23
MKVLMGCLLCLFFNACFGQQSIVINDTLKVTKTLLYEDDFESSLNNWIVEQQAGGSVNLKDGKMEITDVAGATIWYNKKITAPMLITYDAVVIDKKGPHDRVSDLNCFWLASDPNHPDDFFYKPTERNGKFGTYDGLKLYYVGLGGHNNTATRFRRYEGTGDKPLLPEHDLSAKEFLITPNEINHIKIIVYKGIVQYYRNNQLIYDFLDDNPYNEGYFAIRTVDNHMTTDNFKVYSLK